MTRLGKIKISSPLFYALLLFISLLPSETIAEPYELPEDREIELRPYFEPPNKDLTPRNYIVPPLLSFLIPGADQWVEGQFKPAGLYTSTGALGAVLLTQAKKTTPDNRYRDLAWSFYFTAGGLSAYHSFRTALTTRIPNGEFSFMSSTPERPSELLEAPIDLTYLGRWTTLVPLGLAAGVFFVVTPTKSDETTAASLDDGFYAGSVGYLTGIGEEAFFRGFVLPVLYEYTGDQKLTLGLSSLLFALGHGLKVSHFVTAFFFGLYSGWLTQENNWSIGEVTFIHTWWDIMAFVADYTNHRKHAFLKLPTIAISF
ncbi:MAG: CPBP family intramembrane metalloprotease [Deltaproteobacteria bacterium]|nr:CPBP family intramembrane metalloprotease [Deltaproteobacteria bacterium]